MTANTNDSISIGRENCDINISHQKVSRRHADIKIVTQSGRTRYLFRDRSSNGTMIDGRKIHNSEIEIVPQNHPVILLAGAAELKWDAVEEALRKRGVHGNSSTPMAAIPANPPVYQQAVPIQVVPVQANPPQSPPVRARHGFTSFWLWLCLLANLGVGVFWLYWENWLTGGLGIGTAIAIIMILCWKKWGFWALIGIDILMVFSVSENPDLIGGVIGPAVISIAIIFGVLHLRNAYGVNSWEQLE